MEESLELSECGCRKNSGKTSNNHYQEIVAEAIGNQLVICVEKQPKKWNKSSLWDPPCDCEIPEIIRPSKNEGPKIINVDENNEIIFRISSKCQVSSDDPNFRAQPLSHKVGQGEVDASIISVLPQLEGNASQKIERDHVTVGDKNLFMMRIKKKADPKETKNRNIELEVEYQKIPPRIPTPPLPPFVPPQPPPGSVGNLREIDIPQNGGKTEKKTKKKGKKK